MMRLKIKSKTMKKTLFFVCIYLIINLLNAQTTILFEEDFRDNARGWTFRNEAKFYAEVYHGNYILKNKSLDQIQIEAHRFDLLNGKNFQIEAQFKEIDGLPEREFGLIWDMENAQNYRVILLNGKGFFRILEIKNGQSTTLQKTTDAVRLINPKGRANELIIKQKPESTEFFMNGKLACAIRQLSRMGNQIGFRLDGYCGLAVASVRVSMLSPVILPQVFHDDFTDNMHRWNLIHTATSRTQIENGKFLMQRLQHEGSSYYTNEIHVLPEEDFELEAHLKQLDGKSAGYGLVWGMKDLNNLHGFLINNNGYFKVFRYENNQLYEEKDWTKTSGLVNPFNAFNKLTIRKQKGKISYLINDHLVHISEHGTLYGEQSGFTIHNALGVAADNLTLRQNQNVQINHGIVQPPEIILLNPNIEKSETSGQIYNLQIGIKTKAKINSAKVYVNNRLMDTERGFEVVEKSEKYNLLINKKIRLVLGSNAIRIEATDNYGSVSLKNLTLIRIENQEIAKPNIIWMNPLGEESTASESVLTLKAGITSESKIIKARVYLNNELVKNRIFEEVKPGRYKYALMIERNMVMQAGKNEIRIVAENQDGGILESTRTVSFRETSAVLNDENTTQNIQIRTDYALLFATDEYDHWGNLMNPVHDAETLAKELSENYGFRVEVVKNADKKTVLSTLKIYATKSYLPEDQLFIFFAGHGKFDTVFGEGYVVCKNSLKDDDGNSSYIPHSSLRTIINNIPTKHTLLAMDVCFGGTFDPIIASRGEEDAKKLTSKIDFIRKKMQFKTRKYLTSGGKEYVPDGVPGQHSPFMRKFLTALRNYGGEDGILTTGELLTYFQGILPAPRFGEFGANEPGSDFIFIAKN